MTLLLFVLVSGSIILSHSHPLLLFYGCVHYLNRCGLSVVMCYYMYIHMLCFDVLLVYMCCVVLQLGDIILHMYVVMVT